MKLSNRYINCISRSETVKTWVQIFIASVILLYGTCEPILPSERIVHELEDEKKAISTQLVLVDTSDKQFGYVIIAN